MANRDVDIRSARGSDLGTVTQLDERHTGLAKPDYWAGLFVRCVEAPRPNRFFLVAESEGDVIGFVVGEIRTWEFGSPPCGWVFAINVVPGRREHGVGTALMDAICERFRAAGANSVRTMLLRRDTLNLAFFRSQGMIAGEYIQLEKTLAEG
ncbi:MAG: GNAT family N-acetyltransferase [Proteobacteria bacterium]|nr:GNAT family N-acetyltransferase [Pseudomonadota bacterium]